MLISLVTKAHLWETHDLHLLVEPDGGNCMDKSVIDWPKVIFLKGRLKVILYFKLEKCMQRVSS